jgi:hypothetical protein
MLPLLVLLAACQTTRTTGIDKAVCSIWTPATYSASQDSQQTIDGNRALNARRDAYCR